jgi:hypothetical protein
LKSDKKDIFSFLFPAGILVLFLSCAPSAGIREERPYIWITDSSKYTLLPPENIINPLDNYQLISASYGSQSYQINSWVKADETGIDITFLNELGANMGELSWCGGAVSFSSPVFPQVLNPRYIIADFQFCFYDAGALAQALKESGLTIKETETGRLILKGDTVIIEITKDKNIIRFVNHLRGYAYTLEGDFQ